MKKIYTFATLVALLLASVSCSQDAVEDVGASFDKTRLTIEIPESRTSLGEKVDGEYPVFWSEGDKIVVNGTPSTSIEIREGGKRATFDFLGSLLSTPYNVTYPYTEGSLCAADRATVVFAAEQQYVEGTFDEGSTPMCGYSEGGSNISLKHLAGLVRLSVKGVSTISKIEIIAEEGVALSGEFDVNCQEGTAVAIEGKTSNTVTYLVNQTLSQEAATIFHIAVPAGNLGQCKFVLSDDSGLKMNAKWNATDVKAGVVREFKEFAYKGGTTIDIENFSSESDDLLINGKVTNKIFYTSSDGNVVTPFASDAFGANIVSNTYENGEGVITFDGDVTSIGANAFKDCTTLATITFPETVTEIGTYAFMSCENLPSINIPNSITYIGADAFSNCLSLDNITIPDGITEINNDTFAYCTNMTTITIPDSVISIGAAAFNGCSKLSSITIPNSVTSIGDQAFMSSGLQSITLPDSVTEIGELAFYGCPFLTSVTIPDSVTTIRGGAFSECKNIEAFYGKYATSDNCCLIVDGVLNSFAAACGATTYTIPNGVTAIGLNAVISCKTLTDIFIPNSVTSIGHNAFLGCSNLANIYCRPTTPPAGGYGMFDYNASERKIYVPAESVEAYKAAEYWINYEADIVGTNFTELPPYGTEDGELVY